MSNGVEKVKSYMWNDNIPHKKGYHDQISLIITILAISIMFYIGLSNLDTSWGTFAIMQASLGVGGFVFTQFITGQNFGKGTFKRNFEENYPLYLMEKEIPLSYGVNFMLSLLFGLLVVGIGQWLLTVSLTITVTEQALYFVFASVCEELAFRGFIIELITIADNFLTRITAVIISAVAFAIAHTNYYGDTISMLYVILLGTTLAIDYLAFRNITSVILIHLILNVIATSQWLFSL